MTFTIMTDSTADLNQTWAEDHDIVLIGLTILCDGEVYETVGPNRISSDYLLKKMKAGSHPQTSQINVGEFEKVFREHAKNNKELLYLALSCFFFGFIGYLSKRSNGTRSCSRRLSRCSD